MSAVRMNDNERVALELYSASVGQTILRREIRQLIALETEQQIPFYKVESREDNSEHAVQVINKYRRDIIERIKAKTWVAQCTRELTHIMNWCKLEGHMRNVGAVVLRGKNRDSYEDKHFSLFTKDQAPQSYRGPRCKSLNVSVNRLFIKEVKELLTFAKEYQHAQWVVEREEREFERAKHNVDHFKNRVATQEKHLEELLKIEVDGVSIESYVETQLMWRKEVEDYIEKAPHKKLHYCSVGFVYDTKVEELQNAKQNLERAKEGFETNQKTIREYDPASVEHKIMIVTEMKAEIYAEKYGLVIDEEE